MPSTAEFLPGPGAPGLVSVIIPTYDRAHFLIDTLDSLLAQTFTNFEAVVVDDGSRDNTREIMARYTDPRIHYFYKENGGLSSARNFGLDRATGEFIAFLDSDDLWMPWKLAAQMELFRRLPDVGMICTDMTTFATLGRILDERHLRTYYAAHRKIDVTTVLAQCSTLGELDPDVPEALRSASCYHGTIFRYMYLGNLVHPPTAIVRRSRLQQSGGFEPWITGEGADDYHFYFKITEQGPIAFIDAPSILYRVHANQISTAAQLKEAHSDLRVITHWLKRNPDALAPQELRKRLASTHGWVGTQEFYVGNHRAAMTHLWRSLCLRPKQPFSAMLLALSLLPPAAMPALRQIKQVVLGKNPTIQ